MNLFIQNHDKSVSRWQWMNQPEDWGFDGNNELTVVAPPRADFFIDPARNHPRWSAPFLYTFVEGDFTISTQVEVEMRDDFDSACLMVMVDDENWAKLCFEYSYKQPTIVSVVTTGTSDDCNSQVMTVNRPFLRISRHNNCFAFHYSLDGAYWYLVRYFRMESPLKIKVGVVAQSPVGQGCRTRFSGFSYTNIPVINLRSGD